MVSTRRGVRVSSPAKTNPDQPSDVPPTPSTGRAKRRAAKPAGSPTHDALMETSNQLEKNESGSSVSPPPSLLKRCARASRLHSPELPCTPVDSTHEGDVSDIGSSCSVPSDIERRVTRTRSKRRQLRAASSHYEEVSEVESCCSAVSELNSGQAIRRSTRKKKASASLASATTPPDPDQAPLEAEDIQQILEREATKAKKVSRSLKKSALTRSPDHPQAEDSEVSGAESCTSSVSGAAVTRRVTRSRRPARRVSMCRDEASDCSHSPAPRRRPTRATRGKASADVTDPPSPNSDGFESGSTYSITTRGQATPKGCKDSDSDLTDRGTPCSSRGGSGNHSGGVRISRSSVKKLSVVLEKVSEPLAGDSSLNDSLLESTVIAEDADRTLSEEPVSQTPKAEENGAALTPVEVSKPAVMVRHQQEEPSTGNTDADTSEMEMMQEMMDSSELVKRSQSVTVTECKKASGVIVVEEDMEGKEEEGPEEEDPEEEKEEEKQEEEKEEEDPEKEKEEEDHEDQTMEAADVEAADVETHSSQGNETVEDGDTAVETGPSQDEKMEPMQVTSSQHQTITVASEEQQQKDIVVQKTKTISLLDSSDDEEEADVSGASASEEEEERAGPSKSSGATASSVGGLFMIDTRPGQEADEHYFKESLTEKAEAKDKKDEQEEEEEEFVDEEGDDDDNDEDTKFLFSSRNPQLSSFSTRIDPGIKMKQLGGLYISLDGGNPKSANMLSTEKKMADEAMKKSVIGPEFHKLDAVPPYKESKKTTKLKHRAERAKSTGDGWFNMKAPELTPELKGDLQVLKMRGTMDSKRFYKKNDREGYSKYFQVGTVVDNPVDFYHSRVPKKERKRTMVEELLADAEFRHKNKKKYQQIMTEKAAQGAGRKNRKKNKFQKK